MNTAIWAVAGFAVFATVAALAHWLKQRLGDTPQEDQSSLRPSDEAEILTRSKSPFI